MHNSLPNYQAGLLLITLAALALSWTHTTPALAESQPIPINLSVRAESAFFGSHDSQIRIDSVQGDSADKDVIVEDLYPSFGASLAVDFPVLPYFSPGFMLRAMAWSTQSANKLKLVRNLWLDINLSLRGHYAFLNDRLSVYLFVPVGLTINRFSKDVQDSFDADWYHGIGINTATLLGFQVRLHSHLSVFVEGGWGFRYFAHGAHGEVFGAPASATLENVINQAIMNIGLAVDMK